MFLLYNTYLRIEYYFFFNAFVQLVRIVTYRFTFIHFVIST